MIMTCTCLTERDGLLGCGTIAQQRALYEESKRNCEEHGEQMPTPPAPAEETP